LHFSALWRRPDFVKLWAGQTVSLFGSQLTSLALPMTAVLALRATPMQLGLLGVAQNAPFLLIALFAGVWIDRVRRRPILILSDVGRGVTLAYVPVAAAFGSLRIEHLYVVAFLLASMTLVFDVAHIAFLSSLIRRAELTDGNGKLHLSRSLASIIGPGVAGYLLQLFAAPVVIFGDAASFLVSAIFLRSIRRPELRLVRSQERPCAWAEVRAGVHTVWADRTLRSITARNCTFNLFASFPAIYLLFLTQDLALPAGVIGLVMAIGGVGGLVGAFLAGPVARKLGVGPAIAVAATAEGIAGLFAPLAVGPRPMQLALLGVGQFACGLGGLVYGINQLSLRQACTPASLHGRVNATIRFLVFGAAPLGSLLGGILAESLGLRATLVVAAIGMASSSVWIVCSPLREMHAAPGLEASAG